MHCDAHRVAAFEHAAAALVHELVTDPRFPMPSANTCSS